MNSVQLTGRFTRDPEIRYANSGSTTARFTIACDRRFKQEGGPTADFISCVAFGKTAEFIEKYFFRGMKIELCGRIQTGSYQNQEGQKVYTTDVIAETVGFAESKAAGSSAGADAAQPAGGGHTPPPAPGEDFMSIPDGFETELPFN